MKLKELVKLKDLPKDVKDFLNHWKDYPLGLHDQVYFDREGNEELHIYVACKGYSDYVTTFSISNEPQLLKKMEGIL